MKSNKLSQTLKVSLMATVLSTLPLILPVSAQTSPTTPDNTAPTTTTPANPNQTTSDQTTTAQTDYGHRNDFDWGWLGLLGLFGLLGLKRKPEDVSSYRREVNTDPTTIRSDSFR